MSNTSRLIDKLIDKKLVKRSLCKENRRKVEIIITGTGKLKTQKKKFSIHLIMKAKKD